MQYSRPRIICNGAPPEGEKTPTTYVGAGSLTDAELERLILRETKALKATDTQETEEPRVGVADAVELQPPAPSPNTVAPPSLPAEVERLHQPRSGHHPHPSR